MLAFVLFVNDTHDATQQTFAIPAGAAAMLGLEAGESYAARNLASSDAGQILWTKTTEELTGEGVWVDFPADQNGSAFYDDGAMVQFLKLEKYNPPDGFKDPQGNVIEDPGVIGWLSDNGFTQDDIDDLGNDAAATDRLYECWLLGCDFRVPDAGGALSITGIAVSNGVVSLPVQFVRKAPLGAINGMLYFYGANDLAAGFSRSPIAEEAVSFGENDDPSFGITPNTVPASGVVTQTVTAAIDSAVVTNTFFKAVGGERGA